MEKKDKEHTWKLVESSIPASDDFCTVWVWDSQKAGHDKEIRGGMIQKPIMELERLETEFKSKNVGFIVLMT